MRCQGYFLKIALGRGCMKIIYEKTDTFKNDFSKKKIDKIWLTNLKSYKTFYHYLYQKSPAEVVSKHLW